MLFKKLDIVFKRKHILIVILVFITAITFETFQQMYYINRYELASDVSFFTLLKNQSYSWTTWIFVSALLIWYVKKTSKLAIFNTIDYLKYALVIISLVFLTIVIISLIQYSFSGEAFSLTLFFGEYVTFFVFQKVPIYTLGYISISMILHLYFSNKALNFKIEELGDIKSINKKLYERLKQNNNDKSAVLNIKIGNKRKIIAIEDISWIEADDYCVKVHTNDASYTMRSSLKLLQSKLGHHFLRVHRKALVNMKYAKELHLTNSPNLVLNNNAKIPVSKSNLKLVRDFLN